MTTPLKILHVITGLFRGGAETMLLKVARTTAKDEFSHTVVALLAGGPMAVDFQALGIPLHQLTKRRAAMPFATLGALPRIIHDEKPDVIQGWMYHGNVAALTANAFSGPHRPVLWNIRQSLPTFANDTSMTKAVILVGIPLGRSAGAIIYNSERAAADHERIGYAHRRRVIIPNGFDTDLFRPNAAARPKLIRDLSLPPDAVVIGRIGNFHSTKDYPMLMAAFAAIADRSERAHLVLIGRDVSPSNPDFSKLMEGHPGRDRIHALGERSDVNTLLPGFDVMVSSSAAEAFPNVIGEAMACAIPTIATDAGDCRRILADGERIAPVGDAQAFAIKTLNLVTLSASERAVIGAKDRAHAVESYSIGAVAAEYAALWQRIATKRAGGK